MLACHVSFLIPSVFLTAPFIPHTRSFQRTCYFLKQYLNDMECKSKFLYLYFQSSKPCFCLSVLVLLINWEVRLFHTQENAECNYLWRAIKMTVPTITVSGRMNALLVCDVPLMCSWLLKGFQKEVNSGGLLLPPSVEHSWSAIMVSHPSTNRGWFCMASENWWGQH